MEKEKNITARKQQALRTKEKLFTIAMELFSKKGYDMVSVDEIVAKAGTSKGSFYTHFKSKDQVIIEQFQKFDAHYLDFYHQMPKDISWGEKLFLFFEELISYTSREIGVDIMRVTYSSQLGKQEQSFISSENRPINQIIEMIIKEGQLNGEFITDIPPGKLSKIMLRSMRGWVYDWCLPDEEFDLFEEGRQFIRTFIDTTVKKPS